MNSFLEMLKAWGPMGAFVVSLIDGIGLPNPGGPDYLVLFLAWKQPETAMTTGWMAVLGAMIGSMALYWFARKGGEKYLDRRARGRRAMKFRRWFRHYGLVTVFIPALVPMVPLPMKLFVLCSGAFSVNPIAFLVVLAAGKIPRYLGLAYLGKQLGEHSTQWVRDHRLEFALGGLALLVILFLLVKLTDVIRSKKDTLVPRHE